MQLKFEGGAAFDFRSRFTALDRNRTTKRTRMASRHSLLNLVLLLDHPGGKRSREITISAIGCQMQLGQINLFAWQPLVSIARDGVVHEWVFLRKDGHSYQERLVGSTASTTCFVRRDWHSVFLARVRFLVNSCFRLSGACLSRRNLFFHEKISS
jgi:hypothetical protein